MTAGGLLLVFFILFSFVANLIIGVIYGWRVSDSGVKKLAKFLVVSLILGTASFVIDYLMSLVLGNDTFNLNELMRLSQPTLGILIVLGFIGMLIGALCKWLATKL